jgi:hypothetical protein
MLISPDKWKELIWLDTRNVTSCRLVASLCKIFLNKKTKVKGSCLGVLTDWIISDFIRNPIWALVKIIWCGYNNIIIHLYLIRLHSYSRFIINLSHKNKIWILLKVWRRDLNYMGKNANYIKFVKYAMICIFNSTNNVSFIRLIRTGSKSELFVNNSLTMVLDCNTVLYCTVLYTKWSRPSD